MPPRSAPASLVPEPRPLDRAPHSNKDRAARSSWGSGPSSTGYRPGYRWTFSRSSSIVVWHCGLALCSGDGAGARRARSWYPPPRAPQAGERSPKAPSTRICPGFLPILGVWPAALRDLGCRFSLLSRVSLLTLKDLSVSRPVNFRFIEYSFSFISRVRVPHSDCEKYRYILDST